MLLRLAAAAFVIVALARPVLDSTGSMAGGGPVLLVIDNGWASASEWPRRMQMANTVLDRAARAGRAVALLATAPDEAGAAPKATAPLPVPDIRSLLGALHPQAWPSDRAAAVPHDWNHPGTSVVYIADGLLDGSDFAAFDKTCPRSAKSPRSAAPPDRNCCCRRKPRPTAWSCASPAPLVSQRKPPRCWRKAAMAAPWRVRHSAGGGCHLRHRRPDPAARTAQPDRATRARGAAVSRIARAAG